MTSSEFNSISERFYTCYSSNMLKHLKSNGCFYLFKCINEKTVKPFWVFDRNDKLDKYLSEYQLNNENK